MYLQPFHPAVLYEYYYTKIVHDWMAFHWRQDTILRVGLFLSVINIFRLNREVLCPCYWPLPVGTHLALLQQLSPWVSAMHLPSVQWTHSKAAFWWWILGLHRITAQKKAKWLYHARCINVPHYINVKNHVSLILAALWWQSNTIHSPHLTFCVHKIINLHPLWIYCCWQWLFASPCPSFFTISCF